MHINEGARVFKKHPRTPSRTSSSEFGNEFVLDSLFGSPSDPILISTKHSLEGVFFWRNRLIKVPKKQKDDRRSFRFMDAKDTCGFLVSVNIEKQVSQLHHLDLEIALRKVP